MQPIDHYLTRMERQRPSADFVERLFEKIHVSEKGLSAASRSGSFSWRWREWGAPLTSERPSDRRESQRERCFVIVNRVAFGQCPAAKTSYPSPVWDEGWAEPTWVRPQAALRRPSPIYQSIKRRKKQPTSA